MISATPTPLPLLKNPGCVINDTDINTTLAFRRGLNAIKLANVAIHHPRAEPFVQTLKVSPFAA